MEALTTLANKLQQIYDDLPAMLIEVIDENATLIEDLNIEQLQRGERSDGSEQQHYSPGSVARGKTPGPMTMFHTGRYYRGIMARVRNNELVFEGTDPKSAMLEKKYGPLTGVNEGNIAVIRDTIVIPGLQEKIQQRLS